MRAEVVNDVAERVADRGEGPTLLDLVVREQQLHEVLHREAALVRHGFAPASLLNALPQDAARTLLVDLLGRLAHLPSVDVVGHVPEPAPLLLKDSSISSHRCLSLRARKSRSACSTSARRGRPCSAAKMRARFTRSGGSSRVVM